MGNYGGYIELSGFLLEIEICLAMGTWASSSVAAAGESGASPSSLWD